MKKIIFTVTNNLVFDQRMIRICRSLSLHGYEVTLIGRKTPQLPPLQDENFKQYRLPCFFQKGPFFYIEYNLRLFCWLLFQPKSILCAIDLDTILPVYWISRLKNTPRVYDAHELFCEMKEIATRPIIYKIWKAIEKHTVPHFNYGYTVNQPIADEFKRMYHVHYEVIRNMPASSSLPIVEKKERFLIYQGAVNEGRSFETLLPAMQWVDVKLIICGEGNFLHQAKQLVQALQLEEKVIFKGNIRPDELKTITAAAWVGITLFDARGMSNYYSLANRFFDYVQAGIPQLCVDYPVYRQLNNLYPVAVLVKDLSPASLSSHLNELLQQDALYFTLQEHCRDASTVWNWEKESQVLIQFYQQHFK